MVPQRYEFRVQGALSDSLRSVFTPLVATSEADGAVTVLSGRIVDQAELSGILQAFSSLGLVLLEVRPVGDGNSPERPMAARPTSG
jgi:hypothetical protein